MGNPRIVRGRRGTDFALAVRGRVLDAIFLIAVDAETARALPRIPLEGRLLEEARSLIRRAQKGGVFPWEAHRFQLNEHGTWEKTLSAAELDRLMTD